MIGPAARVCLLLLVSAFVWGCAPPPPTPALAAGAPAAVLPTLPVTWHCAAGLTSHRSNGVVAVYKGADPSDPGLCLATIGGKDGPGYLGVWDQQLTPEIRAAILRLVTASPGTTVAVSAVGGIDYKFEVLDRNDFIVGGKAMPTIHFRSSTYRGNNEIWMDATNGMFFKVSNGQGGWEILSIGATAT